MYVRTEDRWAKEIMCVSQAVVNVVMNPSVL